MTELLIGFLAGAALTVLLNWTTLAFKLLRSKRREQARRIERIDSAVGRVNRTAWDAKANSLQNIYDISNLYKRVDQNIDDISVLYKKVEKLEEWKAGEW